MARASLPSSGLKCTWARPFLCQWMETVVKLFLVTTLGQLTLKGGLVALEGW